MDITKVSKAPDFLQGTPGAHSSSRLRCVSCRLWCTSLEKARGPPCDRYVGSCIYTVLLTYIYIDIHDIINHNNNIYIVYIYTHVIYIVYI